MSQNIDFSVIRTLSDGGLPRFVVEDILNLYSVIDTDDEAFEALTTRFFKPFSEMLPVQVTTFEGFAAFVAYAQHQLGGGREQKRDYTRLMSR